MAAQEKYHEQKEEVRVEEVKEAISRAKAGKHLAMTCNSGDVTSFA